MMLSGTEKGSRCTVRWYDFLSATDNSSASDHPKSNQQNGGARRPLDTNYSVRRRNNRDRCLLRRLSAMAVFIKPSFTSFRKKNWYFQRSNVLLSETDIGNFPTKVEIRLSGI